MPTAERENKKYKHTKCYLRRLNFFYSINKSLTMVLNFSSNKFCWIWNWLNSIIDGWFIDKRKQSKAKQTTRFNTLKMCQTYTLNLIDCPLKSFTSNFLFMFIYFKWWRHVLFPLQPFLQLDRVATIKPYDVQIIQIILINSISHISLYFFPHLVYSAYILNLNILVITISGWVFVRFFFVF